MYVLHIGYFYIKAKIYAISSDTPITAYQTAPFQTRKILIDLVISW